LCIGEITQISFAIIIPKLILISSIRLLPKMIDGPCTLNALLSIKTETQPAQFRVNEIIVGEIWYEILIDMFLIKRGVHFDSQIAFKNGPIVNIFLQNRRLYFLICIYLFINLLLFVTLCYLLDENQMVLLHKLPDCE
jgi:hypothetical protein